MKTTYIEGRLNELNKAEIDQIGEYRKEIFLDKLKWNLTPVNGKEIDEFDQNQTFYIARRDHQGKINAHARLTQTTEPYLLQKISFLWEKIDLPKDENIWEVSRFSTTPTTIIRSPKQLNLIRLSTIEFIKKVIKTSEKLGAKSLVMLSTRSMENFLKKNYIEPKALGNETEFNGEKIKPLVLEVKANQRRKSWKETT